MLEMIPGSLVEQTASNLSDFPSVHSDITPSPTVKDIDKVKDTHAMFPSETNLLPSIAESIPSLELKAEEVIEHASNNIEDTRSNTPVFVKRKFKTCNETRLLNLFKKYNISSKKALNILNKFKKKTKEKQKLNRVLSFKLNRHYFKRKKLKWSQRYLKTNRTQNTNNNATDIKDSVNKDVYLESTNEEYSEIKDDQCLENADEDCSENKTDFSVTPIPDFKAEDDIRNKIKKQLELLRMNRKLLERSSESESQTEESKIVVGDNKVDSYKETNNKANINDVVLSNEGELSIINVVGGYISDEERQVSEEDDKKIESVAEKRKKTSITDILLKRELCLKESNELLEHLITPTKTNDITKIKGWRTKQFAVLSDASEIDDSEIESSEKSQEKSQFVNVDEPVPSTSAGFCAPETKPVPISVPDNILKQGESVTPEDNKKSAFVSDVLDTFLTNHSELKISYEVPKLVAEEAITKRESEMPVPVNEYLVATSEVRPQPKIPRKAVAKPKTLAEKRRMLEMDRQNKLIQDMESNENTYLHKLEQCTLNKTNIAKSVRENIIADKAPISRRCWNLATKPDDRAMQFISLNGHKIRITGSTGGAELTATTPAKLEFTTETSANADNKIVKDVLNKPAKSNKRGCKRQMEYKPGPLSKKQKLMSDSETASKWECSVLKMPKIKLVVYPEQGKQLPSLAEKYLQLCQNEDGHISDQWAKFAVTAVRTKEKVKTKNKFEFDLPYANEQNKILARKRVYRISSSDKACVNNYNAKYPHINVDNSIKNILSDMLNCIENQELDKLIIKEDPDLCELRSNQAKDACRPLSPINSMVQAIIKRPNARRSKTTLELRRLNVQVIEVDVKDEEPEVIDCTNDFCRLGCVCHSLRGVSGIVPEHCGREQCMLKCSCSLDSMQRVHHSITLPAGTDLLSASTVVRLQDEVKRNLAKEERKFTQTVIKANNQTIMVGDGTRDRQRRVSKIPKKYSNYVQKSKGLSYMELVSSGLLEDDQDPDFKIKYVTKAKKPVEPTCVVELKKPVPIWDKDEETIKNTVLKDCLSKRCCVKLEKLNLSNAMPWCMIHNLYKCYCGGKAIVAPEKTKKEKVDEAKDESVDYIPYVSRSSQRKQLESAYWQHGESTQQEQERTHRQQESTHRQQESTHRQQESIHRQQEPTNRQQELTHRQQESNHRQKEHIHRQQEPTHRQQPVSDTGEKYCARTRAIPSNYQTRYKSRNNKVNSTVSKVDKMNTDTNLEVTSGSRRQNKVQLIDISKEETDISVLAQKITIVNIDDIINSPNDSEQSGENVKGGRKEKMPASEFIDYERSFVGILTPSKEWLNKFQRILNLDFGNTVIHQIRLLEWATLVERYRKNSLYLWFSNKKYNNVLLTEDRRRPSYAHMNIKMFEKTQLENFKIPEILTCLLNQKLPGVAKRADETYVILVYNGMYWVARGTVVLNNTSEMCRARLGHKRIPINVLSPKLDTPLNLVYPMLTEVLVSENNASPVTSVEAAPSQTEDVEQPVKYLDMPVKQKTNILVPLPTGLGLNRWFMLILENDFSVLRISFSNFHIKYTHLEAAIQMARKNKKTVRIRSQDKPDKPYTFGIYAVPEYNDRIFFGPYRDGVEHGLETFRFVNGKLVNTKIYNKMRGSTERKTRGTWFTHNSTLNNSLSLEPQSEDSSSNSECTTEVPTTSVDKAVKPQIEFVDLTGNDSENEGEPENNVQEPVDPLYNILSTDFNKRISNDITIEPIYDTPETSNLNIPSVFDTSDIVIKCVSPSTSSPITKPTENVEEHKDYLQINRQVQPAIVHSINLEDDDDTETSVIRPISLDTNSTVASKQTLPNLIKTLPVNIAAYIITNIPGVGYFEVYCFKNKFCLILNMRGNRLSAFKSIKTIIAFLDQLFRTHIFVIPENLGIRFSVLDCSEIPAMPKFNEDYLNGYHVICEKGIFNLLFISTEKINNLQLSDSDTSTLLAHKCELLINRNVKLLGNYLVGPEESNKLNRNKILEIAPKKIKVLESEEVNLMKEKQMLINTQKELREQIKYLSKNNTNPERNTTNKIASSVLKDNNLIDITNDNLSAMLSNLPAGKNCKIVDSKVVAVNSLNEIPNVRTPINPQIKRKMQRSCPVPIMPKLFKNGIPIEGKKYQLFVPITGLPNPVTVVGLTNPETTPGPSLLVRKQPSPQKVVDLTDD